MGNKFAVLDLGTNTWHLLLVESTGRSKSFNVLDRSRHYVFLADEGIDLISDAAIARAKAAVDHFVQIMKAHPSDEIKIVGTEGLRKAANGAILVDYVKAQLGQIPEVISGAREAELIYKGNALIVDPAVESYIIMDIGGGSTEFIWVLDDEVKYSRSHPLGVSKLYYELQISDPIRLEEQERLRNIFSNELKDLTDAIANTPIRSLIGASGTFEAVGQMLKGGEPSNCLLAITIDEFQRACEQILPMNIEERKALGSIPLSRVNLISTGMAMMQSVISLFQPEDIAVSPYAIKEGLIAEWLATD